MIHPGADDAHRTRSYSFRVTSVRGSATDRAAGPAVDPAGYRWMRPLAVVAIAVVVTATFQTEPGPGTDGRHLAIALTLLVFGAGTIAFVRTRNTKPAVQVPLLVVVVLSAALLVGLQPDGAGFLGVFPAVSSSALRLPSRASAAIAGVAIVALAVAWSLGGGHPVVGIILNEFGVVAFYLLATVARRLREVNARSQQLILELEQSRAAQAEAAALSERQRLAREMHDVLAHSLSGLVLNLEGARLIAERTDADPQVTSALSRAHRLAKSGLEEARRAIGMLRDDALPGPARFAELATAFEQDTGTPCTLTIDGQPHDLDGDSRLTLYRVAQEALTNVRKHTCPDRVELRLGYERHGIRLTIADFATNEHEQPSGGGTGYGLTGMRERAELLGGTLTAAPTSDGYRVELWIPR